MALVIGTRTKETSSTTGTGTYSLLGTSTGFRTFVAGVGNGNTTYYVAEDGTNWEEGVGTVTDSAPDTLARTQILSSSNGGAAVNWGAGTRNLFSAYPGTGILLTSNNLSDLANVNTAKQNLGIIPVSQTGGTNGKVVRVSSANTWTDASRADTIDQLVGLMFRSGGFYYPTGSIITGLSSLTAGSVYYLDLAASSPNFTITPPTPSASVRLVVVGKAISTTVLLFNPMTPIGG